MPQRPFEPCDLLSYLLAQLLIMVHQAFGVLVEDGEAHCHVVPVEDMLGLWAHVELEITDRVAAIGEKRDLLVQLHPLGLEHRIEPTFGLLIQRLHEPKALARGEIVVLITSKASVLFPTTTSKWCFLASQSRT